LGKFFEDFNLGERFVTSGRTFTEAEIVLFASVYDAQSFHTDVHTAKSSIYGGLIASGFHTLSVAWSLFLRLGLLEGTSMGSPGLNYVKWFLPVKPGDTLKVETEVVKKKETSKSDRGIVVLKHMARIQSGEIVLEYESAQLISRITAHTATIENAKRLST
jgi:acyl dehydratase